MKASQIETKNARPSVRVSPASRADVFAMARLLLLAFETAEYKPAFHPGRLGLPIVEVLRRDGPLEEQRLRRGLLGKDIYMKATVRALVEVGSEMETIVGWAKWSAPQAVRRLSIWEGLWSKIVYPLHEFFFRPALASGLPNSARALLASQHMDTFGPGGAAEGRKHWYLRLLCVDPAWQGFGIGGALLQWGMEKARESDAAIYLETSPAGRPLYDSKGFRVTSEKLGIVNGIQVKMPGMIWDPAPKMVAE